jgi:hypothetical protein
MHYFTLAVLVINFVIGAVTVSLAVAMERQIANLKCSDTLRNSNAAAMILGTVLITASLVFGVTELRCSGLNSSNDLQNHTLFIYYIFIVLLSIGLTVIGALIRNNSKTLQTDCSQVNTYASTIMIIGIIGILVTVSPAVFFVVRSTAKDLKTGHRASKEQIHARQLQRTQSRYPHTK